jgi:8-oxo-dGTP pyrophosphatase MutT (NUDIX family)
MHRQNLLQKLKTYTPLDDLEERYLADFIQFVQTHADCFERSLEIGHITGSAWLVDPTGTKVLLTHHKKLDRWLQLGGHADGEPDILAVAYREAREESGIEAIRVVSEAIFDLDIHPIPAHKKEPAHYHYDVRFALQVYDSCAFTVSAESKNLAWIEVDELPHLVTDESILRMQRKWQAMM